MPSRSCLAADRFQWSPDRDAGTTAGWTLAARVHGPTVPMVGFLDARSAEASADNVPQKVVLREEDPGDSAGKSYVGSAVWRTEEGPPRSGQKPNIAARSDIEIPARNISIRWSLRRNDDKQLPASHLIEIVFTLPPDFPRSGISNIPGMLMKQGETMLGVALSALTVKVTTNFFLVGLSSTDLQRNIELLEWPWFDIPVIYGNGKRAIITIEKGEPGERAFTTAIGRVL